MNDDWLDEVRKRIQQDEKYQYWKRSADQYEESLRIELTEQQYAWLVELLLAHDMMRIYEKDHAYEVGVIHGRKKK